MFAQHDTRPGQIQRGLQMFASITALPCSILPGIIRIICIPATPCIKLPRNPYRSGITINN
jgi:hypothetical protein